MTTRIQNRRGTAAEWSTANPVLADGEPGFEKDTGVFKVGDGVTTWNNLKPAGNSTFARNGLPDYAPDGLANHYDPARNVYNWKPANTLRLRASLGRAQAGAGRADHLFLGDSETDSAIGGSTYDRPGMWPFVYRNTLAALGIPKGGTGHVWYGGSGTATPTPGLALSAGWNNGMTYVQSDSTAGRTATYASETAGTAVDILYLPIGQVFTVTIDGGTPQTVNASSSYVPAVLTISGLSDATHTVVVTTVSGSCILKSINVYRGSGLVVHDRAVYGTYATGTEMGSWSATTGNDLVPVVKQATPNPDAVWVALGVNDYQMKQPMTPATVAAGLTWIRNQFPSSDVVLVAQYQPADGAPTPVSLATWETFVGSLYTLADTLDVPLVDLLHRTGGNVKATAAGLMGDVTHPNAAAQRDWGRLAAMIAGA